MSRNVTRVAQKLRAAIKAKLMELGAYLDEELPDYIMVMIANKKTEAEMIDDLRLFLGNSTIEFAGWLQIVMHMLDNMHISSDEKEENPAAASPETELANEITPTINSSTVSLQEKEEKPIKEDSPDKNIVDDDKNKTTSGLGAESFPSTGKIILMQSDDDDDDEDFINIKADAEAADFDRELSKDEAKTAEKCTKSDIVVDVTLSKIETNEAQSPSNMLELKMTKATNKADVQVEQPVVVHKVTLTEDKIPLKEKKVLQTKTSQKETKRQDCVKESTKRSHTPEYNVKENPEMKRRKLLKEENSQPGTADAPSRRLNISSRVVALSQDDTTGAVASVVHVKPRPVTTSGVQPSKNLLLRAMAEARRSVATAPRRPDPTTKEEKPQLFTRHYRQKLYRSQASGDEPSSPIEHDINGKLTDLRIQLNQAVLIDRGLNTDTSANLTSTSPHAEEDLFESNDALNFVPENVSLQDLDNTDIESADAGFQEEDEERLADEELDKSHENEVEALRNTAASPDVKFVVTLDGLNTTRPPIFNGDHVQESSVPCADSAGQSLEAQDTETVIKCGVKRSCEDASVTTSSDNSITNENITLKAKRGRIKSPIRFIGDKDAPGIKKSLDKCKYWPNCRLGESCNYLHPSQNCINFPNCKLGDKCIYIHPNCKYGISCSRRNCAYTHAKTSSGVVTKMAVLCKYFPNCYNATCPYMHNAKPCRYGANCSNAGCKFNHVEANSADRPKFKWVSAKSTASNSRNGQNTM